MNLHFPTLLFIADCIATKIDKPIHAKNSFLGGATRQAGQAVTVANGVKEEIGAITGVLGISLSTKVLKIRLKFKVL